tara:strand:- start:417 stop:722 length:306 start_codon:yes stop_codon:yes gene_type:complete
MASEILNIIEEVKTNLSDLQYKTICDLLMTINNQIEAYDKKLEIKEKLFKATQTKLKRMVNRYLDISVAFVGLYEEKEGVIYDRMISIDCDCNDNHEHVTL